MSLSGQCLCGEVTITVARHEASVSICHCRMCRVWTGTALAVFEADGVDVQGKVARYRSSEFAERAFCPTCGTPLWIRDDGAGYELVAGLFDTVSTAPLSREVYSDRATNYLKLADGGQSRISAAEYETTHPFVEGDRS